MPLSVIASRSRLAVAALVAASFAYLWLIWPALSGPFVFDDFPNLAALANHRPVDSWRALGAYLAESRNFPGRPLAMLAFLPQQADWPGNPFPFKLVNALLHIGNAGLAFLVVRRLLTASALVPAGRISWLACLVAVAWLVHPMQQSAVLLVVQRMTLLSATFVLLGLLAYLHGLLAQHLGATRRAAWMIGGIAGGGLLGILCKESAVLLPVYAWAMDALLLRQQRDALPPLLRRIRQVLLYLPVLLLLVFLLMQLGNAFAPAPTRNFSVYERLLTQPRVLWDYAVNLALPRYGHYGIYHDDILPSRGLLSPWSTLPSLLLVVGVAAIAFAKRRQWPLLAFAVAWYLGGHLLESTSVPLELYFDHRNYLPLLGPLFAIVVGISRIPAGKWQQLSGLAFGLWLVASLLATALYTRVWSSRESLSYFLATSHPASIRAQTFFAQRLFEEGRFDDARDVLVAARSRRPDDVGLDLSITLVDCRTGTLQPADMAPLLSRITQARWSQFAYDTLSPLQRMAAARTCPALDVATWYRLSDAFLANPAYKNRGALGQLHYQRHAMAVAQGRLSEAISELDETAKYESDPAIVRLQAKYLADAGLPDEAIRRLEAFDPDRRDRLRRWLVDDVAINHEAIRAIRAAQAAQGTAPR